MEMTDKYVNNDLAKLEKNLVPNICRACMARSNNMKCVSTTEGSKIIEELEFCTGILINKEDGLPTKFCKLCLTSLAIASKFKKTCLRSDNILRNVIKKPKIPQDKIKIEKEEVIQIDENSFEYQELAKQEIASEEDDGMYLDNDDLFEIKLPSTKQKTRSRLKNSSKKKMRTITINISGKKTETKSSRRKMNRAQGKGTVAKEINSGASLDSSEQGLDILSCHACDLTFASIEEQMEHKANLHGNCVWICEICGKTFKHRSSHYSHVRSHLPPTHQCDRCDYRTWHKADLNKHLRMHNGIKNFVCEYCTKGFHNSSNLRGHIRRNHTIVQKNHACPRCDRTFYAPDKLRRHLDTHDNIKRFECEVCHDRFTRRCQWKTHLTKMHDISIPKLRPGRRKTNVLVGVKEPPASASVGEQNCVND